MLPDCEEWPKARDRGGYGIKKHKGRKWRAHRLAFHLAFPGVPIAGRVIMHKCDNPPCVNVDHLRVGTNADNSADMVRKGRSGRRLGEANRAKLTEADVRAIRADPRSSSVVAREYGVSDGTVRKIRRRERWGHVD